MVDLKGFGADGFFAGVEDGGFLAGIESCVIMGGEGEELVAWLDGVGRHCLLGVGGGWMGEEACEGKLAESRLELWMMTMLDVEDTGRCEGEGGC